MINFKNFRTASRISNESSASIKDETTNLLKFSNRDDQIAEFVIQDIRELCGSLPTYSEGDFYVYEEHQWRVLNDYELMCCINGYNGFVWYVKWSESKDKAIYDTVVINRQRMSSIEKIIYAKIADKDFFLKTKEGLVFNNCFLTINEVCHPVIYNNSATHKQRKKQNKDLDLSIDELERPFDFSEISEDSYFYKLLLPLKGSFEKEEGFNEALIVLAKVFGSALFGLGTKIKRPKAIVLEGDGDNGKSEIIKLLEMFFTNDQLSSVKASMFFDEKYRVRLRGKSLNRAEELSEDISPDDFKAIISGNIISGKDPYQPVCDFAPMAQHIFSTNSMPLFKGGIDKALKKRIGVLRFLSSVKIEDQIPDLALKIFTYEYNLVMHFAVWGACNLKRTQGFDNNTLTEGTFNALATTDVVVSFIADKLMQVDGNVCALSEIYEKFKFYCQKEYGVPERYLLSYRNFIKRLRSNMPAYCVESRHSIGPVLKNIMVKMV